MNKLPSKEMLLEACSGTVLFGHPVLSAACELAALHAARMTASDEDLPGIDCARAKLVHCIDCWVSANMPLPRGAAYMHTETVGMVVDRIGRYSVDAEVALRSDVSVLQRHYVWERLAELALAYTDLAFEIGAGLRKVPFLIHNHSQRDSTEQEHDLEHPGIRE
ncbi:hypothetical protein BJY24_003049 [Nocardia transvalensis]|uniref:DUF4254 domain-containing protein n=1 Tax=Nocardia transvalensis TaxID=37333 RepID=A0A7W9PDI5_9NOCA|nr:DUF4254 domain-containing protein [Nocardia transvalensis]MBB5914182.1 hypothetical protein [Nocardia transvalensis]